MLVLLLPAFPLGGLEFGRFISMVAGSMNDRAEREKWEGIPYVGGKANSYDDFLVSSKSGLSPTVCTVYFCFDVV